MMKRGRENGCPKTGSQKGLLDVLSLKPGIFQIGRLLQCRPFERAKARHPTN